VAALVVLGALAAGCRSDGQIRAASPAPGTSQPAWSCSSHGSTPEVDRCWVPVLERYRVALVLNGHDHNYQRFVSAGGSPG